MFDINWLRNSKTLKSLSLTDKELDFFRAHCEIAKKSCGAKNFKDLQQDNYSCATVKDFQEYGFSKHQTAGLIGSLEQKSLIWSDDETGTTLFWIEDDMVKKLAKEE